MYPPYVYLTYPREDETVAGSLAAELERRGVAVTRHVSDPGAPLIDADDPALSGATAVLLAGRPAIADDDSVERVLPHFRDRVLAVALDPERTGFELRWYGVRAWNFGDWRGDPDNPQLDDVARTFLGILGTNTVQRSSSAQAVLAQAAGRSSSPNAATAVLLEALVHAPRNGGTGTALRDLLARNQGLPDRDIIDRIVSMPESAERQDADLRPGLDALLDLAYSCASRVSATSTVHLRHLLAAAVIADNPPVDDAVLTKLGTDAMEVRNLLLEAVRGVRTGDSLQAWEELLAERLAGGFVPDLVDLTLPISRDRDDLGQGTWAAMFASLIADEATPMPVSIGLFGEWGAGKSTFMGLLRGEIDRLCGQPGYVRDVMQIVFDAWHYADTNLWASIGDEIFPALMRRLTPGEDEQEAVKQRAAELQGKITAGLVTAKELEGHAEQAQRQTQRLAAEVRKAQEDQVTASGLLGAALKSSPLRGELDKAWRRLGVQDQAVQVELFADQLDGIRQDRRALRAVLGQRLTWAMATICLGALLVTLAGAIIPVSWAGALRDSGAISTITLVLGCGLTLTRRVGNGMAALRSAATEAAREKDQAIQAARDKLKDAQARQQAAEAKLRQVSAGVAQLQRELAGLTPGQRLYAFLAERSASADYSGQVGIISTIRKDFQHLVRVLKEHRATANPADPRIDRIVLYIDDLDRCPPRQVVDVLQAVHLLLALDLFVVVVGVDPRWLVRSLREQYPGILAGEPGHTAAADQDLTEAIPSDYLQKIFNIPFALPAFRSDHMERLVLRMAGQRGGQAASMPAASMSQPQDAGRSVATITAEPGSQVEAIQAASSVTSAGTTIGPRPQHLTHAELAFLGGLGPFIRTPRDAKRLLNIYRMLRATRDLSPASRFLNGEYQAVAMLLAMLTLDPHVLRQALDAPAGPDARATGGLTRQTPGTVTWVAFAERIQPAQSGDTWRNEIAGQINLAELPGWQRMAQAVNATKHLVKLNDLKAFCEWAPRIRHFSYTLGTQDAGTTGRP